jgi:hypothetical protein
VNPPRTIRIPSPIKTRPTVEVGRHQGPAGSAKRSSLLPKRAPELRGSTSSSGSLISSGMPGKTRPFAGTPACTRRKRDSPGASSSKMRGRDWFLPWLFTPEQGSWRAASLHYRPQFMGFFPQSGRGNPGYNGAVTKICCQGSVGAAMESNVDGPRKPEPLTPHRPAKRSIDPSQRIGCPSFDAFGFAAREGRRKPHRVCITDPRRNLKPTQAYVPSLTADPDRPPSIP